MPASWAHLKFFHTSKLYNTTSQNTLFANIKKKKLIYLMQKRLQHLIYQQSTETQEALSLLEGTSASA